MYYKINVPDRVFVAKAKSIEELITYIVNETEDADLADAKDFSKSFFSVEPLTEDLKVKGRNYKEVIQERIDLIVENSYFDLQEEDSEEWVIIEEADNEIITKMEV